MQVNLELLLLIEDKFWQIALLLRQYEDSKLQDFEVDKLVMGLVKYLSEYL